MIVNYKFTAEIKHKIFDDIWILYEHDFNTCISNDDVDGAHKSWCQAAEHYCHKLEQLCSDATLKPIPKCSIDKVVKFENKKLTAEWNSVRNSIDDIDA